MEHQKLMVQTTRYRQETRHYRIWETEGDRVTAHMISTVTRKRIIVLACQVDCSFFLSFRFLSSIHNQRIISLNRNDLLVYLRPAIPGYGVFGTIWTWNSFNSMRHRWQIWCFDYTLVILIYSTPSMVTITASGSPPLATGRILENA